MASWLRRTPLVVVAAAAVLAGCTTGGEASKDAARVLGDLATIQPCSLTDVEVFAEFGSAEFGPPESLDYCTVVVKPDDADEVTIMIGELARPSADPFLPTDKLEDVNDSIYTTKPDDVEVSCWQTVVFAEADLALSVRSLMGPIAKPAPTCDMVAAGVAKVVDVILAGKVEHRSPAPNSLIALDPCDLVADETVTALPGFAEARRVDSPGRHRCDWRTSQGTAGQTLSVTFDVAQPPKPSTVVDSIVDPIAGRPSVTTYTDRICGVETGHLPFEEIEEATGFVERVEVNAGMSLGEEENDQTDQPEGAEPAACEGALAIAKALWPRLPPLTS